MARAAKVLFGVLIAALVLALIFVAVEFVAMLRALRAEIPHVDQAIVAVQAIETDTQRTEAELAGLLNSTRHIALDEQQAQQAQLAAVQTLAARSAALVDDADAAVKQFGGAAQSLGTVGSAVNADLLRITDDSHALLATSNAAMIAATADLESPQLADTLAAADKSAQNLAATTATAAHTMQTVDQTVSAEAKIVLAPASKIKAAALFAASIAGHLLGI